MHQTHTTTHMCVCVCLWIWVGVMGGVHGCFKVRQRDFDFPDVGGYRVLC